MGYEIRLRESAMLEIEQALDYYLSISPQLGFSYDEDLGSALTKLEKFPNFEIKIDEYRVLPLSKFPFIVIFTVLESENIIDVISIFHTSQNPIKYPK